MLLEHIGRAGESHVGAFFHLGLVHPGVMEIAQDGVGVHARDAVCGKTHIELELAQRAFGVGAERAADAAAGEPERAEGRLKLFDVFSREVRRAQIQQALAELETLALFVVSVDGFGNHRSVTLSTSGGSRSNPPWK